MSRLRTAAAKLSLPLVVLGALASIAAATSAEQPAPYSVHDLNQDGYLDRSEYAEFLSRFWARRAQGRSGRGGPPPLEFDRIDLDSDGLLTEQEMTAALEHRRQHRRWRRWPGQGRAGNAGRHPYNTQPAITPR